MSYLCEENQYPIRAVTQHIPHHDTQTVTQPEVRPHLSLDLCLNSTIALEWDPITAY